MNRYFNTTGLCNPQEHYMVDPFRGLKEDIYRLIEAEQYFLIHATRFYEALRTQHLSDSRGTSPSE